MSIQPLALHEILASDLPAAELLLGAILMLLILVTAFALRWSLQGSTWTRRGLRGSLFAPCTRYHLTRDKQDKPCGCN